MMDLVIVCNGIGIFFGFIFFCGGFKIGIIWYWIGGNCLMFLIIWEIFLCL